MIKSWMVLFDAIVVIIAISVALLFINMSQQTTQPQKEIKIGAIYPLTGNFASYGEWAVKGTNLATDEINAQSGIDGKKVNIILEDSKAQPSDAVTAYNKLRDADGIKYILTLQSSVALAVEKFSNQDRIIQMDVSATTPLYSTPNDYSFRTGISATQLAAASSNTLFDILNVTRIGVLYINNDFGRGMVNVFKNTYKGSVIAEETFDQGATDFRTQLLKLKDSNVSTIFLVAQLKEGGILVKQSKELGFNIQFFSDVYSIEGPDFIDTAKDSANGIIYVSPKFDVNDTNPSVVSFAKNYRKKYKEDPTYFAAQAYDGLIALSKAMKNCSYNDTDCVQIELMKLDFEGASGRIKFDVNGDVQKPVELKMIKNQTFVEVK